MQQHFADVLTWNKRWVTLATISQRRWDDQFAPLSVNSKNSLHRVSMLHTKKSLTFPEEIADNMFNKCTFINGVLREYHVQKMNYRLTRHTCP